MSLNFTNKRKSRENAKYSDRAQGGGTGNYTFQRPFSQNLTVRPGLKFWELLNTMTTKPSTCFKKDLSDSFSVIIIINENRRF